jgi:hypothetical protein
MRKLTDSQLEDIKEVLRHPGYALIMWQQDQITKAIQSKLNTTREDHRFFQGELSGAQKVMGASEILMKRRSKG